MSGLLRKVEYQKNVMVSSESGGKHMQLRTFNGYLHMWGQRAIMDGDMDKPMSVTMAVIEHAETGQVFTVDPYLIKFTDTQLREETVGSMKALSNQLGNVNQKKA